MLLQVCRGSCDAGHPGAPHLLQAGSTAQMPATALHEASAAPQDLGAVQHTFLASDLYLTSKACLQICSHTLQNPEANT